MLDTVLASLRGATASQIFQLAQGDLQNLATEVRVPIGLATTNLNITLQPAGLVHAGSAAMPYSPMWRKGFGSPCWMLSGAVSQPFRRHEPSFESDAQVVAAIRILSRLSLSEARLTRLSLWIETSDLVVAFQFSRKDTEQEIHIHAHLLVNR